MVNQLLHDASHLRSTASTKSNNQSSRSHAVCCITLRKENGANRGQLRVVDLAGSERREDANEHTMERISEMKDINWSLGCLKECIRCQVLKEAGSSDNSITHIPYRNCRLTMLLKDCFTSSDVKTSVISHVSPTWGSHKHTANTLDYTIQMIQITRAEQEKKKFAGPETWSAKKMSAWVRQLEGGRFANIADCFQISGKMFSVTWRVDIEKRAAAAGGLESDGAYIYDKFHAGLKKFKEKQRKEKQHE